MIKKAANALVFLLVLSVFIFSLYKIITISDIWSGKVWGRDCSHECPEVYSCDICASFSQFCSQFSSWCDQFCGGPTETPVETPTATPTETEPSPTPEEPSPTPEEEPTPSEEEPTPTEAEPTPEEEETVPAETETDDNGDGDDGGAVGGTESVGTPKCGLPKPGTPVLLQAQRNQADQADLVWTKADLATHYSIAYGLSSGHYQYGVDNTGRVTDFAVGGLDPDRNYCFAVRAVNDCAPGDLSNEICTGQVLEASSGQVLGATTLADTGYGWQELAVLGYTLGCLCISLAYALEKKSSHCTIA